MIAQGLTLIIYAAILMVLVRPGSPASAALVTWGDAVAAVIGTATGFTQRGGT